MTKFHLCNFLTVLEFSLFFTIKESKSTFLSKSSKLLFLSLLLCLCSSFLACKLYSLVYRLRLGFLFVRYFCWLSWDFISFSISLLLEKWEAKIWKPWGKLRKIIFNLNFSSSSFVLLFYSLIFASIHHLLNISDFFMSLGFET